MYFAVTDSKIINSTTLKIFMKLLQLLLVTTLSITISQAAIAQAKTEKFKVAGECGMCKKKIEKAAKDAGATFAEWNVESKELIVKFNSRSSNTAKIQQHIATVGYDTPQVKATNEAYDNLHGCCKYERTAEVADCCKDGKCVKCDCCKDGKCSKNMDCCKSGNCEKKDCCTKS
jgi:hypothetical protein